MKTAIFASLKRSSRILRKKKPVFSDNVGMGLDGSVGVRFGLATVMPSMRSGIDSSDRTTPFIVSDASELFAYYSGYQHSFSAAELLPYAETIPLRRGTDGFSTGVDTATTSVHLANSRFEIHGRPEDGLKAHARVAKNLFMQLGKIRKLEETNEWENNQSVRICSWNIDKNEIIVQPATYFDQVATNLTMDWASGMLKQSRSATLRNDVEQLREGYLPPLSKSKLANSLGVAVVLYSEPSQQVFVPIRGGETAVMDKRSGSFHCSASGVFHWYPDVLHTQTLFFDFFTEGMQREIKSELGLDIEIDQILPLAFSRELPRGGKPQLFFLARTDMTTDEIQSSMRTAEERWEFIQPEELPGDSPLRDHLTHPFAAPELFSYEGRMAFRIAQAFLDSGQPPFEITGYNDP